MAALKSLVGAAVLAALLTGPVHAENESPDENTAIWKCFHSELEKMDDGAVALHLLSQFLVSKCRERIRHHIFAKMGSPKYLTKSYVDGEYEQWRLVFIGSILEKRKKAVQ